MSDENNGAPEGVTEDTAAALVADQDTDLSGDEAAAGTDEGEAQQPKPKKTAQDRFDELTRARREAEREAEYWKAKATQPQQQPAHEAQAQAPQGDGKPDPNDYENGVYDPQFIEDLTDWKAEAAAVRMAERTRQTERVKTAVESYETRSKALYPDGKPAGLRAFERFPELTEAVVEIVAESDIGPKIAEHLGDNPAEFARLQRLSPIQQARELTRLENRLSAPPRATPKTATDAPDPPPQARGSGGRFTVAPDTDDFAAFEKQYGQA